MTASVVRTCGSCGNPKTLRPNKTKSGHDQWSCLPCDAVKAKEWRKNNRELSRLIVRKRKFMRVYGITLEQRDQMIADRDGKCDICGRVPNPEWQRPVDRVLHVDHNHTTGVVRGMLCGPCNKALAWYETHGDQARRYLDETRSLPVPNDGD